MAEDKQKLLIVEDDPGMQKQLRWCFEQYEVEIAADREEALVALRRHEPSVVLQDLGLPPDAEGVSEGLAALQEILKLAPNTKVIVVTGNDDHENAVKAVAMGAYDFYSKPVDVDILNLLVTRAFQMFDLEAENRRLQEQVGSAPLRGIIANSDTMLRVCRLIEKVAPTSASTLLLGESGTGKEMLARALHDLSPRKEGRFVAINCAAIPENLLESELFGYEKGAFTGATKQTPGKFELADGGTLFLDEIGDMPLALQVKLLRFLQERVIERLGGRQEIPVDVRVVFATNKDLQALMKDGEFREDLYYRVSEVVVDIPPLRDRGSDGLIIARHLLEKYAAEHGRGKMTFSPDASDAILAYSWPGNVRELENKIKTAVIMADGSRVSGEDLSLSGGPDDAANILNLRQVRQRAEGEAIRQAIRASEGNMTRAAELLGITRPTLYDLMKKNGIQADA